METSRQESMLRVLRRIDSFLKFLVVLVSVICFPKHVSFAALAIVPQCCRWEVSCAFFVEDSAVLFHAVFVEAFFRSWKSSLSFVPYGLAFLWA